MTARETALAALIACRRQGAWSDGVLKELIGRNALDRRDAALASRLCYGVLQNQMLLDFYLEQFLHGGIKRLQPQVADILRLGAFQILLCDKIPPSAAVNEAVEQAKRSANRQAAGLVNAVLRNLLRNRENLRRPTDLATRYSHPQPLVELLTQAVGENKIEPLLAAHNTAPEITVQTNCLKITTPELAAQLKQLGIGVQLHPWLADCLILSATGSVEQLDAFRQGLFYVQDPAAKLAVQCADLAPGMTVLDCCAAPGGKSFAAAIAMENRGKLISCDIHPHKIALIEKGAARLGLTCLHAQVQDASKQNAQWLGQMDAVIADVPCSGLGVIRKKPDIRYKDLSQIERLPQIQQAILQNQAAYVRPGGVLLYSTCTVLPAENQNVIARFLASHPEFSPEPLAMSPSGMITLLPCEQGTDGFFICKLRRER